MHKVTLKFFSSGSCGKNTDKNSFECEGEKHRKMVDFRLRSTQSHITLLEQNQIQPCIFFWMKNKNFSHCSSKEECIVRYIIKEEGFNFVLSVTR